LPKRDFRESERSFVLVLGHVHRLSPIALGILKTARGNEAADADLYRKLGDSREGPVNRFGGKALPNESKL
jgi:hypothetical protein